MKQSVEINRRNKAGEKENMVDLFCSKKKENRYDLLRTFQKNRTDLFCSKNKRLGVIC